MIRRPWILTKSSDVQNARKTVFLPVEKIKELQEPGIYVAVNDVPYNPGAPSASGAGTVVNGSLPTGVARDTASNGFMAA